MDCIIALDSSQCFKHYCQELTRKPNDRLLDIVLVGSRDYSAEEGFRGNDEGADEILDPGAARLPIEVRNKLILEVYQNSLHLLAARIQATISRGLFGGYEDTQSTHFNNCICHALDVLFDLFKGKRREDLNFSPSSPVTVNVVGTLAWSLTSVAALHDDLCEIVMAGEHRFQILRELIDDELTEDFASQMEIFSSVVEIKDDIGVPMATFNPNAKTLRLTVCGLHKLFQKAGLLESKPVLATSATSKANVIQQRSIVAHASAAEEAGHSQLEAALVPVLTDLVLRILRREQEGEDGRWESASFDEWLVQELCLSSTEDTVNSSK